ncbi:MAG: hypothetical protein ACK52J_01925 [bacterium]
MTIYGKEFLILDCDEFTHNYFKEKLKIDFPIEDKSKPAYQE